MNRCRPTPRRRRPSRCWSVGRPAVGLCRAAVPIARTARRAIVIRLPRRSVSGIMCASTEIPMKLARTASASWLASVSRSSSSPALAAAQGQAAADAGRAGGEARRRAGEPDAAHWRVGRFQGHGVRRVGQGHSRCRRARHLPRRSAAFADGKVTAFLAGTFTATATAAGRDWRAAGDARDSGDDRRVRRSPRSTSARTRASSTPASRSDTASR